MELPPPPEPDHDESGAGRRLPASVRLKLLGSFALAAVGIVVLPRLSAGGAEPPVGTMLAVGLVVGAVTLGGLWLAIRRDLKLPTRVGVYFVAFESLIVLVKFVLAPMGFYQANGRRELTSMFGGNEILIGAGVLVLVLYLAVYTLLFLLARRSLVARGALSERDRRFARRLSIGGSVALSVVVVLAVPALLLITGAGSTYLSFVFSSGVAAAIAVSLVLASVLVVQGFRSIEDRSGAVADATVLLNLFWLGFAFIVLFHVLWVVYVLVLSSVWPLRVVVPK